MMAHHQRFQELELACSACLVDYSSSVNLGIPRNTEGRYQTEFQASIPADTVARTASAKARLNFACTHDTGQACLPSLLLKSFDLYTDPQN